MWRYGASSDPRAKPGHDTRVGSGPRNPARLARHLLINADLVTYWHAAGQREAASAYLMKSQ